MGCACSSADEIHLAATAAPLQVTAVSPHNGDAPPIDDSGEGVAIETPAEPTCNLSLQEDHHTTEPFPSTSRTSVQGSDHRHHHAHAVFPRGVAQPDEPPRSATAVVADVAHHRAASVPHPTDGAHRPRISSTAYYPTDTQRGSWDTENEDDNGLRRRTRRSQTGYTPGGNSDAAVQPDPHSPLITLVGPTTVFFRRFDEQSSSDDDDDDDETPPPLTERNVKEHRRQCAEHLRALKERGEVGEPRDWYELMGQWLDAVDAENVPSPVFNCDSDDEETATQTA